MYIYIVDYIFRSFEFGLISSNHSGCPNALNHSIRSYHIPSETLVTNYIAIANYYVQWPCSMAMSGKPRGSLI